MSFGFSIGDFVSLTQLAWTTVQNSRKACGVHDELTREVTNLHIVLQRLQREVEKPSSLINQTDDGRLDELRTIVKGCNRMLKIIDQVLVKYNGMSEERRRVTRFKLKVKFGNGEMEDLEKIKQDLSTYTSAINLFVNLLSMDSQGKVEVHMETHGEELRELRQSLNWITASLQASSGNREGSILTSYADDDKAIWKEFRRELLKEGFSSTELSRHKTIIKNYVMELGARGALDIPEVEGPSFEGGDTVDDTYKSRQEENFGRDDNSTLQYPQMNLGSYNPSSAVEPPPNRVSFDDEQTDSPLHGSCSSAQIADSSSDNGKFLETMQITTTVSPSSLDQRRIIADEVFGKSVGIGHGSQSDSDQEIERDDNAERTEDAHASTSVDQSLEEINTKTSLLDLRGQLKAYPQPVSLEEAPEEDFMPGAHPNCEPVDGLAKKAEADWDAGFIYNYTKERGINAENKRHEQASSLNWAREDHLQPLPPTFKPVRQEIVTTENDHSRGAEPKRSGIGNAVLDQKQPGKRTGIIRDDDTQWHVRRRPSPYSASIYPKPDVRHFSGFSQSSDSSQRIERTPEEQAAHDKRVSEWRAAKARPAESQYPPPLRTAPDRNGSVSAYALGSSSRRKRRTPEKQATHDKNKAKHRTTKAKITKSGSASLYGSVDAPSLTKVGIKRIVKDGRRARHRDSSESGSTASLIDD